MVYNKYERAALVYMCVRKLLFILFGVLIKIWKLTMELLALVLKHSEGKQEPLCSIQEAIAWILSWKTRPFRLFLAHQLSAVPHALVLEFYSPFADRYCSGIVSLFSIMHNDPIEAVATGTWNFGIIIAVIKTPPSSHVWREIYLEHQD